MYCDSVYVESDETISEEVDEVFGLVGLEGLRVLSRCPRGKVGEREKEYVYIQCDLGEECGIKTKAKPESIRNRSKQKTTPSVHTHAWYR